MGLLGAALCQNRQFGMLTSKKPDRQTRHAHLTRLPSLQPTEPTLRPLLVHPNQSQWLLLPESDELTERRPQLGAQLRGVPVPLGQQVERLRQECGEIDVLGVDLDPRPSQPGLPQITGCGFARAVSSHIHRQRSAHSPRGHIEVLSLTAALAGLGCEPRGAMCEDDGRGDLVAVLSPWSRSTCVNDIALLE